MGAHEEVPLGFTLVTAGPNSALIKMPAVTKLQVINNVRLALQPLPLAGIMVCGGHGSALNRVHGQAPAGGFLVLAHHVGTCLTHRFDRLVK